VSHERNSKTSFPELNKNTGFYVSYYKNSLYDNFFHVLPSYAICWPLLWALESTGTLQTTTDIIRCEISQ
jgi:hypothetical protein